MYEEGGQAGRVVWLGWGGFLQVSRWSFRLSRKTLKDWSGSPISSVIFITGVVERSADRHFHPFAHTASKSGWHPWNPWILTWVNNWDSKYVQPCCLWALTSNRLKCQRCFYLFIVIFRCKHLVCDYCVVCLLERITAAVDSVNETALHVVKLFYIVDGYYFS